MEMFSPVLFVWVFIVQAGTKATLTTKAAKRAILTTSTISAIEPFNTQPYVLSEKGHDEFTISNPCGKRLSAYSPQTFNLNNIVTSGPIILVDKKSLFIPNFRYNGDHKNVHFWVGNGSAPSSNGILVRNENGSLENLHMYQGQDLTITLPNGITVDDIEYFGVWSIDEELNLGHVSIKGIEDASLVSNRKKLLVTDDDNIANNITMKLPKCCPLDSVLTAKGCKAISIQPIFKPQFKIYQHNETHFLNYSLDVELIEFIPYTAAPKCDNKYPLDDETEEFALLQNTSLLIKGRKGSISGILLADKFCLENIEDDNNTFQMQIFVCAPDMKKPIIFTYVSFTIVSTLALAITFFSYYFSLQVEDVHKKYFLGYIFTMMITFLCLTIVQMANVEEDGCKVLGFLFQIFMIASFTLLGILCVDSFVIIKYMDQERFTSLRERWYLGIAIGVPLLFLILSLARNLTPDVPDSFFKAHYLSNKCTFETKQQPTKFFYVPICLAILVSTFFLIWSKFRINHNNTQNQYDTYWKINAVRNEFMFRQSVLTLTIMTVSWISNMSMNFLNETSVFFKVALFIEALQGALVVAVFTMNHYGSNYLHKRRNRPKKEPCGVMPSKQNNRAIEESDENSYYYVNVPTTVNVSNV